MKKEFLTGNEAIVRGALIAGAQMMSGYPITPTTEIMHYWAQAKAANPDLKFLQTEDEMSAGFAMIGAVLAGTKAFTATAGPGNVLMQDAFSMAENLRLPTVAFINQRGGPSTGTVIYSQQELNLTCFGGNGEGLRIVYSASSVQELYDFAIKAFNASWKYRFPTFVLSDGYSAKTSIEIETYEPSEKNIEIIKSEAYLLKDENDQSANLRNCYNLETELNHVVTEAKTAYDEIANDVMEYEDYQTEDAEIIIFAHGIVGAAAHMAVDQLRSENIKVGLFRPITLSPFPEEQARKTLDGKKVALVAESSLGQFERLLKANVYGSQTRVETLQSPAKGISVEEIVSRVKEII
jgi:2-oxoglutarate ferredoxin oxidoreductase subunit alpha